MSDASNSVIVICSNTPYDANPLGAKPLAIAMSKNNKVLYVDPPLSYLTALKQPALRTAIFKKRFSKISENLYRLTPIVLPGKDRPFVNRVTSYLLKLKIKKALRKIKINKNVVLIATAPHYRVFCDDYFNIYWMMDDYESQPELIGISSKVLSSGRKYLVSHCNAIAVVSENLKTNLSRQGIDSTVILNGADSEQFRFPNFEENSLPLEVAAKLPTNKFALYVGGISNRLDISYLASVAETGSPLVIAGDVDSRMERSEFDLLCESPNVYFLGSIKNRYIPGLMNLATIGLVPYADKDFNRASMPLKIPEYLLCGLVVVSTDLPFTKEFSRDDVIIGANQNQFSDRVIELLENPAFPSQRAMRSSRIAQDWSWDKKAEEYLELLA